MQARTFDSIQRRRQGGYTLMEILVAVAIFATVMIVALLLYDQSNRVFKSTSESAEMQQNTRVAYEKVVADLRMAGFDYKRAGTPTAGVPGPWLKSTDYSAGTLVIPTPPDGHVYRATKSGTSGATQPAFKKGAGEKTPDNTVEWMEAGAPVYEQPDEQIEFVHTAAITIRGNFDYNDPTTVDKGREPELEKSSGYHFPVVTTGNDEIVTYALVSRSQNVNANKDTISFFADVNAEGTPQSRTAYPGGSAEREIKITGVDLTNANPPYTLMRYTLGEDGKLVSTALADNIRSMQFSYFQDASARTKLTDFEDKEITDYATLGGLGKYDPASTTVVKERFVRGKIRAVTATIVGMSPQPDYNYKHPSDTVAQNFRQYTLQSTIVGRNLGLKGVAQTDTNPPDPPVLNNACSGYCGVALLNWTAAPTSDYVTYTVLYDTAANGSFSGVLPAGTQTSYAVDLTQLGEMDKTYYFRVAATNGAGTTLSEGSPLAVSIKNATTPMAPAVAGVTGNTTATEMENRIEVTFQPPTKNVGTNPSCTPSGTTNGFDFSSAELKGYRIYRSTDPAFDPSKGQGTVVLSESSGTGLTADGAGNFKFADTSVVNCEDYYYRIAAVEWCAAKPEYNTSGSTASAISAWSAAVKGRAKPVDRPRMPLNFKQTVESVCNYATNRCDPVTLLWDPVVKDVKGNDIRVDNYTVYRLKKLGNVPIGAKTLVGHINNASTIDGQLSMKDTAVLEAEDPLDNKYTYEYTLTAWYDCSPTLSSVEATLLYPGGACVTGATIEADADGPGDGTQYDPKEGVNTLTVVPHASKPLKSVQVSIDGAPAVNLPSPYALDWDIVDGDVHVVTFSITAECTETVSYYVRAEAANCAFRSAVSNVIGTPNQLQLVLTNISGQAITLQDFDIRWTGQTGFGWDSITLPSGAKLDAAFASGQNTNTPRTASFKPTASTDLKINAGANYKILLNFTGSGLATPSTVGGITLDYKVGTDTTTYGCTPQLAACSVTASVTTAGDGATSTTATIAIANSSTEDLVVSKFSIAWSGGTGPLTWNSVTAGTETLSAGNVTSGTRTFTPTSLTIPAKSTANIVMNITKNKKQNPDVAEGSVGDVVIEYTTATSGSTNTLTCRAK